MRCAKHLLDAVRLNSGALSVFSIRCKGALKAGVVCTRCDGVRRQRRSRHVLLERFLARVTLLEEAAQQYLDATPALADSEEAEALRFALKQLREPKP